ncbi:MAG: long-chain fatty acid--CoA ligase, partial [Deltaproteobacteria bacterium]|nr:long-chain fatty acid--CoA ligase [Deltaproteobacteria bacterium]
SLDDDGYLSITGRKKDLLITAGGKNVAPAEMESHISQIPGVGQVVVVGDRKPYLCALVTLDPENLGEVAKAAGIAEAPLSDMAVDSKVQRHMQAMVEQKCNAKVARYQTIKKVSVLPVQFSVDGGEMTPTMKVRRAHVTTKYSEDIAAFYK